MTHNDAPDITTVAIVNEIAGRMARGEAVTKDLVDRLPSDVRMAFDVTVVMPDGRDIRGTVFIENGEVAFHEMHDPATPDSPPQ